MKKVLLTLIILNCLISKGSAQNNTVLDSLILPELIDTLFIDRNVNNWSLRLFTNFKNHRFTLRNSHHALHYVPNNPFGIGVGLATRKVLLDIGFNIESNKEDITNRLDFQANLALNKHVFEFMLHRYKGFNVFNDENQSMGFREDIISFALNLEYLYLLNSDQHTIDFISFEQTKKKHIETSFALGGFALILNQQSDSSLIPMDQSGYFNEYAQITNFSGLGAGIKGSFISVLPLPYNFFTSISISPGFGLIYKKIESEDSSYIPSDLFLLKLDMGGALGYNGKRIYVTFRVAMAYHATSLHYENKASFVTGHAKIAVGYKLGGRN